MLRSLWSICLCAVLVQPRAYGAKEVSILHYADAEPVDEVEYFKPSINPCAVFTTSCLIQRTDDTAAGLSNTIADFQTVEHLSMKVNIGFIHIDTGDFLLEAIDALDQAIANWIKNWSNNNVCDPGPKQGVLTEQNGGTVGYLCRTTTTGKDCRTTAEVKTIAAAVGSCMNQANAMQATTVCCTFTHGGTWKGHLQLTSNVQQWPASLEDQLCWNF